MLLLYLRQHLISLVLSLVPFSEQKKRHSGIDSFFLEIGNGRKGANGGRGGDGGVGADGGRGGHGGYGGNAVRVIYQGE